MSSMNNNEGYRIVSAMQFEDFRKVNHYAKFNQEDLKQLEWIYWSLLMEGGYWVRSCMNSDLRLVDLLDEKNKILNSLWIRFEVEDKNYTEDSATGIWFLTIIKFEDDWYIVRLKGIIFLCDELENMVKCLINQLPKI